MSAISAKQLSKDFGAGKGLFDLNLDVQPGTIHGFLGPNGAGKTTAIRMFLDLLRPTAGSVRILGLDPARDAKAVRSRVGYLPGELALPEMLTGRRYLHDNPGDPDWLNELEVRLAAQLDTPMHRLSKGNKQKIALMDALQQKPELLILDEPTDGLDPLLRHQVTSILQDHAEAGNTVFLSSHVVHEIQTTCQEVSILIHGKLRHQAVMRDLIAEEPTRIQFATEDVPEAILALRALQASRIEHRTGEIRFHWQGDLLPVVQLLAEHEATHIQIQQADLEETFLRLYQEAS